MLRLPLNIICDSGNNSLFQQAQGAVGKEWFCLKFYEQIRISYLESKILIYLLPLLSSLLS